MRQALRNTSTSLTFAIAAFLVTATSAQAFANHEFLTKAGLTDEQVVAIQEARELRQAGDYDAAREAIVEAGIDLETLHELRRAHHQERQEARQVFWDDVQDTLTDEQRDALLIARQANDQETVHAILLEAGVELPGRGYKHGR